MEAEQLGAIEHPGPLGAQGGDADVSAGGDEAAGIELLFGLGGILDMGLQQFDGTVAGGGRRIEHGVEAAEAAQGVELD